jgi:hypothetical protein
MSIVHTTSSFTPIALTTAHMAVDIMGMLRSVNAIICRDSMSTSPLSLFE